MIEYPSRALRALAYLFRPYNDIDVYVEDAQSRNLYEVLLGRMLDGAARIERVIQLGGKDEVLKACQQDQEGGGRRRLYIIDGDLDFVLGKEVPKLKHLYRLEVYCVENLVFSEVAAIEIGYESLANSSRGDVAKELDFPQFEASIVGPLSRLFAYYAAASSTIPELETVAYSVMKLCHQHGFVQLSSSKVEARIREIREALEQGGHGPQAEAVVQEIMARFGPEMRGLARIVSGKRYLLTLLFHHLRTIAEFQGTVEQLKVRLARHCELGIDPALQSTLLRACRGSL